MAHTDEKKGTEEKKAPPWKEMQLGLPEDRLEEDEDRLVPRD